MRTDEPEPRWSRLALLLAAVASAGFCALLLAQVRDGVFYSGDGGLKYLMTAQLARGELYPDLRLQAPARIHDLWAHGLYPFQPPAVSWLEGRAFIQYALFFPLISAPFLSVAGFHGLFVLPLLGGLAALALVGRATRSLGARQGWTAAAVVAVAFGSPLLLYGAMFWEHTLGVALALLGFHLAHAPPTRRRAAGAGALLGVAAWLRPELLVLAALAAALPWAAAGRPAAGAATGGLDVPRWPLAAGVASAVGAFAAWNAWCYGTPVGLHGGSVTEAFDSRRAAGRRGRRRGTARGARPRALPARGAARRAGARRGHSTGRPFR